MLIFSVINMSALVWICTILLWCSARVLKYPSLLFSTIYLILVLVETIGSLFLMSNRSQLMGKFIIMLQFLIIALKLDGDIAAKWNQVYFGFALAMCIAFITLIAMTVFFLINVLYFQ